MPRLLIAWANAWRTRLSWNSFLVVEGDVARRVRRAQEQLEARVSLDHADVVRIESLHPVDLAGLERAQSLRVVLDVAHDDALDLGLLAPEIRIGLEHGLLV